MKIYFLISNTNLLINIESPMYNRGVLGEQYNQFFKFQFSSISNKVEKGRDSKATSSKVWKKRD